MGRKGTMEVDFGSLNLLAEVSVAAKYWGEDGVDKAMATCCHPLHWNNWVLDERHVLAEFHAFCAQERSELPKKKRTGGLRKKRSYSFSIGEKPRKETPNLRKRHSEEDKVQTLNIKRRRLSAGDHENNSHQGSAMSKF